MYNNLYIEVALSGIEPESGASETLILSIVLQGHIYTTNKIGKKCKCKITLFCRYKKTRIQRE